MTDHGICLVIGSIRVNGERRARQDWRWLEFFLKPKHTPHTTQKTTILSILRIDHMGATLLSMRTEFNASPDLS